MTTTDDPIAKYFHYMTRPDYREWVQDRFHTMIYIVSEDLDLPLPAVKLLWGDRLGKPPGADCMELHRTLGVLARSGAARHLVEAADCAAAGPGRRSHRYRSSTPTRRDPAHPASQSGP